MEGKTISGIISLILGLFIIVCPLTGYIAANIVIAVSVLLLGIYALIAGCTGDSDWANIILGIIFIILGILIFWNPAFLAFLVSFMNYLLGILLIIFAIVNLFTKGETIGISILAIIFGIVCIIFGFLAMSPIFLGVIIGIWFVVTGVAKIVQPDISF